MRFFLTIGVMSLFVSPVSADWPKGAHPLNRLGRIFGIGWSDGYHSCQYDARPFGADLPPTPDWLQQRWTQPYALQGMAGSQRAAAPTEAAGHDVDWRPQDVERPTSPPNPPVPPSILEEIRRYERDAEQSELTERLEEQAEYDAFLEAVGSASSRSARLPDSRFIHEPTARQNDRY